MPFRRKKREGAAEASLDLRARALALTAAELGIERDASDHYVWGVLMEIGYPEAAATLVAMADGGVSMYFSNGGGVIGAGEHQAVRDAATALLAAVEEHLAEFTPATETPLPKEGRVIFYVHTFEGLRTAEAAEADLAEERHPLAGVFYRGHDVISQIRLIEESS